MTAVERVLTERVDVPEPVTLAGLKLAVAPTGRPERVKFTAPAKPFADVTAMAYVAALPGKTAWLPGEAASEKPLTFNSTEAVWVALPLDAVIVRSESPAAELTAVLIVRVVEPDAANEGGVKE
jgi:hypothetical protein